MCRSLESHFNVCFAWCFRTLVSTIFAHQYLHYTYLVTILGATPVLFFLRQRKVREIFNSSSLNDLRVIWGQLSTVLHILGRFLEATFSLQRP